MKKTSFILLVATAVHAAVTTDATAFIVAFIFFCNTCGKDVYKIWYKFINS